MRALSKLLLFVLILSLFNVASATTYYVAKTGSDSYNGTTLGSPFLTIQKAANVSEAGDTVYVRNGTYLEIVQPPNNGTVGNYITFTNYNGEVVNINTSSFPPGSGAEWTGAFWIKAKHYLNVTGFNMYGGDSGVHIDKGSSFIIIKDNYIKNPKHSAIKVGFGPGYERNPEKRNRDIIIDNNTVYRNQSGTLEHQEMISIEAAERIEVKNNKVTRNKHGEGIDMKQGTYNSSIHHNVVHDTLDNGYYIDGWADNVDNISVYNNVAYNVASAGFAVGNECGNETRRTTNVTFTNNIAYNNKIGYALVAYLDTKNCGGYTPYYHYDNIKFINNIGYHNGHNETIIPSDRWSPEWGNDYWLSASGVNVTNILLRNNIGYQAKSGALVNNANAILDSNMFSGVDPKWVNASAFDFHLLSNSTAINNGSSILAPLLDFDGNARVGAVEIGAYEYQGTLLKITSWGNTKSNDASTSITTNVSESVTLNATVNQFVNVNWYINGTPVQANVSVISANYTNASVKPGTWIVNATATNANGTVSREWTWTVASLPQVYPRYDVNQDNVVDLSDLTLVGKYFNEVVSFPYPRYDVNMDGVVNIEDITIVGQNFGENA